MDIIKDLIWITTKEQVDLRKENVATIDIWMDLFIHYQKINEQLLLPQLFNESLNSWRCENIRF
jgi:hypothetical protein